MSDEHHCKGAGDGEHRHDITCREISEFLLAYLESELDSDWFRTIYVENEKLPLRRPGEPNEIAACAAWLCSADNTYLTGQVVTVDGGVTVTF